MMFTSYSFVVACAVLLIGDNWVDGFVPCVVRHGHGESSQTTNRGRQETGTPSKIIVHRAEPPRNGKAEPGLKSDRDELVQDLQTQIALLYGSIAEQKEQYASAMGKLERENVERVQLAQQELDRVQTEYYDYKTQITQKLENSVSPAVMAQLQGQLREVIEETDKYKSKLADALEQLRQNRQDRMNLQAEMVALKESYIDKLNELEDELEFAQDERVRAQQEGSKRVAELEEESKQKLQEAIANGRKQLDELTIAFTQRIAVKDEEIGQIKLALGQARREIQDKDETIGQLEAEAQSLRKLFGKSYALLRGRISKRMRTLMSGKRPQKEQ